MMATYHQLLPDLQLPETELNSRPGQDNYNSIKWQTLIFTLLSHFTAIFW